MKQITFVYPQMVMGGAEKVLIRLIEGINRPQYQVSVVLMKRGGELERGFPDDVRIEYADAVSLFDSLRHLKFGAFAKGAYYRLHIRAARTYERKSYYTYLAKSIPESVNSDCAICFSHYNFLSICTVAYSDAKKKILWVHLGFRKNMDRKMYVKVLGRFDAFCCVSEAVKAEFDELFPMYASKSRVIYNLIDADEIRSAAEEPISEKLQHISLLTVARLSKEKGQHMVPAITRKLLNDGHDVYWYLIGDGPILHEIREEANKFDVSDRIILLGTKMNPFPYMRQCDIYVQPTSAEGFCTTTNEARVLCKPVVATDIPSMREQFQNGKNGILVKNSVNGIADGIELLLGNPDLVTRITSELKAIDFDANKELEKLYSLLC